MHVIVNNIPFLKEHVSFLHELTVLWVLLFLHTFQIVFYPFMVRFALKEKYIIYVPIAEKWFLMFDYIGIIFYCICFLLKV